MLLLAVFLGASPVHAGKQVLSGELVTGAEPRAGAVMTVTARLTLESGWHVYAPDPASQNIPLDVVFSGPGVTFSTTPTYPAPRTEKILGEDAKILDGSFEVRTEAHLPDPLPKPFKLTAKVSFQACSDSQCQVPSELELTLPARVEASPAPRDTLRGRDSPCR